MDVEVTAVEIHEVNLPKVEEMAKNFGVKFRKRGYLIPFR
jgi:hypothetical protein